MRQLTAKTARQVWAKTYQLWRELNSYEHNLTAGGLNSKKLPKMIFKKFVKLTGCNHAMQQQI
jgi:hypothetical protein